MASLVSMMVGQCGNQIGAATYAALHAERPFPGELALFDDRGCARAVLVDGEAKVVGALVRDCERGGPFSKVRVWAQSVRRCVQQVPTSLWHQDCAFVEDSGRGNNWALGYYGPRAGNGIVDRAMGGFRRQLEASDAYRGCLCFHSLCGGTGAGLGSRLMEELHDELGKAPLMSTTVLPFSVGELPLQHYNATLCLSRICQETDACFLFANDDVLSVCAASNAPKTGSVVKPSDAASALVKTAHLNRYISLALSSVLRPCVFTRMSARSSAAAAVPWDMAGTVAAVAPTPETKFVEIWSVQEERAKKGSNMAPASHFSDPPWATLGKRLSTDMRRSRDARDPAKGGGGERAAGRVHPRRTLTGGYQVFARGEGVFGGGGGGDDGAHAARVHVEKALELAPGAHHFTQQVSGCDTVALPQDRRLSTRNEGLPTGPSPSRWRDGAGAFPDTTTSGGWIHCPRQLRAAYPRSLAVVASRSGHLSQMAEIHRRCSLMAEAGAYMHWYTKYGFEEEELLGALEDLRTYLDDACVFFGCPPAL